MSLDPSNDSIPRDAALEAMATGLAIALLRYLLIDLKMHLYPDTRKAILKGMATMINDQLNLEEQP